MNNTTSYLTKIREDYSVLFEGNDLLQGQVFDKLKFITGENYICAIDLSTEEILTLDNDLVEIHNLKEAPTKLKDLVQLVHPDDLAFLNFAEKWGFDKMVELKDFDNFKIGYLIRMKTSEYQYDIFYHQTYYVRSLLSDTIINCVHFNSNYKDIVKMMKYNVNLIEVTTNKKVDQTTYFKTLNPIIDSLTKRELEIIKLIAAGFRDKEIAEYLFISFHTVRTHRKNILKKTIK